MTRCFILSAHVFRAIQEHSDDEHLVSCSHEAHRHLHRAEEGKKPLCCEDDGASDAEVSTGRARQSLVGDDSTASSEAQGDSSVAATDGERSESSELRRTVYHGEHRDDLPGAQRRTEGEDESGNRRVDEAYEGAGIVHAFYRDVYGRNSIDDRGMPIDQTVHHRKSYMNAYWNGEAMVYGDGDGTVFTGFTHSLTVIAHEITHGVVQSCGGLTYEDQSGALNESLADVFGVLCEQHRLGHSAGEATWLVGHDIFGDDVNARGLRSLEAPGTAYDDETLGKDPQVAHMDDFVWTDDDNGGVHSNSGIPNHAFYRLAVELGGEAWGAPGRIWYETLRTLDDRDTSFATFARRTVARAGALYGSGSREARATESAWKAVGVL